ncbi:MAG: imidazole glycerol phosphate synthase cyclase subunit [Nitrospirae bacterium]|nr:imidazole glycerol phosphate synthase cyclase subunit [Nitrospirota bacterium]MCL5978934.1 imidazole glycerol phosphate synthase cyclase subunit [Nitrospirota bacterium]
MAKNIRIIPRLDIKGPNLVKGIHLEGLRVLGKPECFARYYYETGADELIYMDIVASLYERNSLHDIISRTAKEIFIPLTVGGGLRTIEDIREVLKAGADKVSLNTAAIKNPEIIEDAARKFGSSTIVVSIEAIRQPDGKYLAYTDNGREYTGIEVLSWAKQVEDLGAGELMITSIDREGTGTGYDIALTGMIANAVSIPVIACGGSGTSEHIAQVLSDGNADAAAVASILHYEFIMNNSVEIEAGNEGNVEFLRSRRGFSKIKPVNLREIKEYLYRNNFKCRYNAMTGETNG